LLWLCHRAQSRGAGNEIPLFPFLVNRQVTRELSADFADYTDSIKTSVQFGEPGDNYKVVGLDRALVPRVRWRTSPLSKRACDGAISNENHEGLLVSFFDICVVCESCGFKSWSSSRLGVYLPAMLLKVCVSNRLKAIIQPRFWADSNLFV
jgi:hypothetical protein